MSMNDSEWQKQERERDRDRERDRERFHRECEARAASERASERASSFSGSGGFGLSSSGSIGLGSSDYRSEADFRYSLTNTSGGDHEPTDETAGKGTVDGETTANTVEAHPALSDEDAPETVAAEIRKQIAALLEAYAVFYVDYKPILDTQVQMDEAQRRIQELDRLERDVPGEQVINSNIEASLAYLLAQRKLIELKAASVAPAQVLSEQIGQLEAYVGGLNINSESSAEFRALRKQSDKVAAQLRSAVTHATSDCAPLPQRSDKEQSRAASRKSKVEELRIASIEAFDGHQQAKIAYDKILKLSRSMDDYRWQDHIQEPRKPSAEEVLQFLENWTARKVDRLQKQRDAYIALADYKRAMSARRKASNKMREIFYRLPSADKMAVEDERAVVRQAERVSDHLLRDDDHLKLGRFERIERQAQAVESVDKPEKEHELIEALREESEMLAYCVGARNFARSDAQKFSSTPEPVPPEPGDYDTGDGYAQALRDYRKACADRRNVIWRKQSTIDARGIQLEAVVAKLAATVDKCLRLKEATDALLVPYLVGDTLVNLFKKREERRHDD